MDIQASKIQLVKDILNINNINVLNKIASFIQDEKKDFWAELSEVEKEEIHKGIEEIEYGEKIAYDNFLQKIS